MRVVIPVIAPAAQRVIRGYAKHVLIQENRQKKTTMNVAATMIAPVVLRVIRGCAKNVSIQEIRQNKMTTSAVITAIVHVASRVISGYAKNASIQENPQQEALAELRHMFKFFSLSSIQRTFLFIGWCLICTVPNIFS